MKHSVEHMLACILEATTYDAGEADSVCISITRETKTGLLRAQDVAHGISGRVMRSLPEAIESLYDVHVERAHKDRVRALGLLQRLDATETGSATK